MNPKAIENGKHLGHLLSRSWRTSPPSENIDAEALKRVRLQILRSASAGLVWWKIRNSDLKTSPIACRFRNAFRLYSIRAKVNESHLAHLLDILYRNGIEPILVKGWAVARCYPTPGLRPYGDFDICVRKGEKARIISLLAQFTTGFAIDIHERFRELEADYDELLKRSRKVALGNGYVTVLSPEDHLRLLCIHTLYHGVWKPGWLCDIALSVETAGVDFDWSDFTAENNRHNEWVIAAINLAHHILGAELPAPLQYLAAKRLPSWVYDGVFEQWGTIGHYMQGSGANELLADGKILTALKSRWPNPLQATIRMNAGFNRVPRLPYQAADFIRRGARVVKSSFEKEQE